MTIPSERARESETGPSETAEHARITREAEGEASTLLGAATPTRTESSTASTTPAIDVPTRYIAGAEIGRGGMGVVVSWSDPHIGREIAAKVLLRDDAISRARFLHEARTQGSLAHPSIVPVHDLAMLEGGRPFFTMQRVKGQTLATIFAQKTRRFSMRKLLEALARMALAMDYAHARGVLHRDLKPANLMLGDFGEVYVLDWGIARRIHERTSLIPGLSDRDLATDEVLGLTSAGTLLGTPGYMSPEQARGVQNEIDERSDVYALGCLLFEILTGDPLHAGTRMTELVTSTLNEGLNRSPSSRAPSRDVPPELDALCLAATDPSHASRLPSVRALAEGLERYLEGDRDVELRMKAAQAHARHAAGLANVALGNSRSSTKTEDEMLDARQKALAEIGRAVALVPEHPVALAALARLLIEPPKHTPAEVKKELEERAIAHLRVGGRMGGIAYAAAALLIATFIALGAIPIGPMPIASDALLLFAAATSYALSHHRRTTPALALAALFVSTIALASLTTLFGPLIVTPTALSVNALVFFVSNERALRRPMLAMAAIGVVLPLGLELTGLLPPSFRFEDGNLVLLPRALPFDATSLFVLACAFVATVVLGTVTLGPFRDDLDRAVLESRVLAWQLRQFVPTKKSTVPPPKKEP